MSHNAAIGWLLVGVLAYLFGYWVSLRVHPYTTCGKCAGGKKWGREAPRVYGRCRRCGGSGEKLRRGARLVMRDRA